MKMPRISRKGQEADGVVDGRGCDVPHPRDFAPALAGGHGFCEDVGP